MPLKDSISPDDLPLTLTPAPDAGRLYPPRHESSRLLVSCIPSDYSASRIARAVEDCDAQLVNLNVTSDGSRLDNRVVVELRVSHRSPVAVARSLERYGYEVVDVEMGAIVSDSLMAERLAELVRYMEV